MTHSIDKEAELLDRQFNDVWCAALDASTDNDFKNARGELNEKAYLKYKANVKKLHREAILAHLTQAKAEASLHIIKWAIGTLKVNSYSDFMKFAKNIEADLEDQLKSKGEEL